MLELNLLAFESLALEHCTAKSRWSEVRGNKETIVMEVDGYKEIQRSRATK